MSDQFQPSRDALGRFAPGAASESTASLAAAPSGSAWLDSDPTLPTSVDVITTDDPRRLAGYVTHESWQVRCDAATNPGLTDDQLLFLSDPDEQPESVRSAVAMSGHPGAGRAVSCDPSPTVRALGSMAWDEDPNEDAHRWDAAELTARYMLAGGRAAPSAAAS